MFSDKPDPPDIVFREFRSSAGHVLLANLIKTLDANIDPYDLLVLKGEVYASFGRKVYRVSIRDENSTEVRLEDTGHESLTKLISHFYEGCRPNACFEAR